MHAFLIVGNSEEERGVRIEEMAMKLNAKIFEFPIAKIEDTRELNKFLRLGFSEPTLIVIHNIHEATIEALNAFLKNLEEPQANINFLLTAPTTSSVLPTIVSRCQIIKMPNAKSQMLNKTQVKQFLTLNRDQRIQFFDTIKERAEAISFIEDLIFYLHNKKDFTNLEILVETLTRLKANANVNLQLTYLAINYQ